MRFKNPEYRKIQPKLAIGQPNDRYEQEADHVADQVMRMPQTDVPIQRKCTDCEEEEVQMQAIEPTVMPIQRMVSEEEEEEVQMKTKGSTDFSMSGLENRLQQNRGSGQILEHSTRQKMERGIGADFSNVNIHTGSEAVQMNRSLNARAFTHGRDIYFNQGEYQPQSSTGQRLLAHELTHVVQQGASKSHIQREAGDAATVSPRPGGDRVRQSPATGVPIQNGTLNWNLAFVGRQGTSSERDGVISISKGMDVRITANFTASSSVSTCPTYTFLQVVKNNINNLPEFSFPHLMELRDSGSGFVADVSDGDSEPFYTAERNTAGTDWAGQLREVNPDRRYTLSGGGRGQQADFLDTPVISADSIPAGHPAVREFELSVICIESGETLGSLLWGYTKTRDGVITLTGGTVSDVSTQDASTNFESARQAYYNGFFQHSAHSFAVGSSRLTAQHRTLLGQIAAQPRIREILLVGANDFSGGRENNVSLSLDRANAVKAHLVSLGVEEDKITTEGHGVEARYPNPSGTREPQNRRVDIRISWGEARVETTAGHPRESRQLRLQDPRRTLSEVVFQIDDLNSRRGRIPRHECDQMRNRLDALYYWRSRDATVPDVRATYRSIIANIFRRCESLISLPRDEEVLDRIRSRGPMGELTPPHLTDRILEDLPD